MKKKQTYMPPIKNLHCKLGGGKKIGLKNEHVMKIHDLSDSNKWIAAPYLWKKIKKIVRNEPTDLLLQTFTPILMIYQIIQTRSCEHCLELQKEMEKNINGK